MLVAVILVNFYRAPPVLDTVLGDWQVWTDLILIILGTDTLIRILWMRKLRYNLLKVTLLRFYLQGTVNHIVDLWTLVVFIYDIHNFLIVSFSLNLKDHKLNI